MPHDNGLTYPCDALLGISNPTIITFSICDMTELVLKRTVFEFIKEYLIQTSGTTIGPNPAPSYGNLFLPIFERDL